MDVYELRRLLVEQLIKERFDGNQRGFATATGLAPSYVSRMLKAEGEENRKRIGEDVARRIETSMELTPGMLVDAQPPTRRLSLVEGSSAGSGRLAELREFLKPSAIVGTIALSVMDIEASMGHGVSQQHQDTVIMNMVVDETWLRRNATFSSPENLALVTGIGDSMRPTFEDGDPLLVDRGVNDIKLDAIYVLSLNDELFIKRIQRRPDGTVLMISDNKSYEPYHIQDGERQRFKVLGRVVMAWNSRRI